MFTLLVLITVMTVITFKADFNNIEDFENFPGPYDYLMEYPKIKEYKNPAYIDYFSNFNTQPNNTCISLNRYTNVYRTI